MSRLKKLSRFTLTEYIICIIVTVIVFAVCVAVGSAGISPSDTFTIIFNELFGKAQIDSSAVPIILSVRIPRVLCVALEGASLAICGGAMQILLRNPLADGSTIGVSSGASLGAIIAIAFGITIPGFSGGGTMILAIAAAFISLLIILSLSYKLDFSLSTNTIILIGVIFSMFASSIISFITTFAGDKVKTITFWTMGSLSGTDYANALTLLISTALFGAILFLNANELNAFAMGEDNARHVGINVKRTKVLVLISVSAMIGIDVSIGGTIGFVGLVIPHMVRMVVGPNAKRLLPASLFSGAVFLMLADLISRTVLSPKELPIGVITSFVGSIVFVYIFFISRGGNR